MPNSRETLKQYCLRSLGSPVVQVNVADEQLEDRIDEAIQYFQIYHYDGIVRTYFKHLITQEEIDTLQISLPDHIYGVKRVLPFRHGRHRSNIFDVQYQMRLNDLYELNTANLKDYRITFSYMNMMDEMLNGKPIFEFNYLQGKLYLEITQSKLNVGSYIVLEVLSAVDPATNERFWNDAWLKRYVESLFKKQWGSNLKKFSNMQLPGGIIMDGDKLYMEATQEIKDLEDELMNKSAPLGFMIG